MNWNDAAFKTTVLAGWLALASPSCLSQQSSPGGFNVIAYYAGRPTMVDSFPVEKLTHIIFSFCHLRGDSLAVTNGRDSLTIQRLVALKQRNPHLKVMLSLGGWGGCRSCSGVFSTGKGRRSVARSAARLNRYFKTDGIDMDWEYPVIEGYPGHPRDQRDRRDFTLVIRQLRRKLGRNNEISFAAGGFAAYIDSSVNWKKVMPLVDRVNLMSYDLGPDGISSHHTPLYSSAREPESVDQGVTLLEAAGVAPGKIAIGAAFYTRMYEVTDTANNGLYSPARVHPGLSDRYFDDTVTVANGFVRYWDSVAHAPYAFNVARRLLATYDDSLSIAQKTAYAITRHLNGIMFWQLADDRFENGLLEVIDRTRRDLESESIR